MKWSQAQFSSQKTWQWPRCGLLLRAWQPPAKEKLKVRLKQGPLPTRKNENRRLLLCRPRNPHPNKLHQGAKYFVKSAKHHPISNRQNVSPEQCVCARLLLFSGRVSQDSWVLDKSPWCRGNYNCWAEPEKTPVWNANMKFWSYTRFYHYSFLNSALKVKNHIVTGQ